jgi:hypothetical protein
LFPPGPALLYPVARAEIDPPDGILRLQWAAVKDLAPDEWYMVELVDTSVLDGIPFRDFTRDTSFVVPQEWRPDIDETHPFRWRISIVQVTGQRSDEVFLYRYGGQASEDELFYWLGAVPTPTPTQTPTPSPTPESE